MRVVITKLPKGIADNMDADSVLPAEVEGTRVRGCPTLINVPLNELEAIGCQFSADVRRDCITAPGILFFIGREVEVCSL